MAFFGGEVGPPDPEAEFAVLPENWEAWTLFKAARTQWRHAGMSGAPMGLDYAGVRVICAARRIRLTAPLLAKLAAIEDGALKAFAEQASRDAAHD